MKIVHGFKVFTAVVCSLACLSLAGCATKSATGHECDKASAATGTVVTNQAVAGAPRDRSRAGRSVPELSHIRLYYSARPAGTITEVGAVSVGKFKNFPPGFSRTRPALEEGLRKQAVRLGGNAVIDIREDFASVSGVAVRVDAATADAPNTVATGVPSGGGEPGVVERLKDIKALRDAGVLTEDEYQSKRKVLIEKL